MVNSCSAPYCRSRGKQFKFHRFPIRKPSLLEKWVLAVDKAYFKPSSSSVLCEKHFLPSDYFNAIKSGVKKDRLKKGTIPSVFKLPPTLTTVSASSIDEIEKEQLESDTNNNEQDSFIRNSSPVNCVDQKPVPTHGLNLLADSALQSQAQADEPKYKDGSTQIDAVRISSIFTQTDAAKVSSIFTQTGTGSAKTKITFKSVGVQVPEINAVPILSEHSYFIPSEEIETLRGLKKEINQLKKKIADFKYRSNKLYRLINDLITQN